MCGSAKSPRNALTRSQRLIPASSSHSTPSILAVSRLCKFNLFTLTSLIDRFRRVLSTPLSSHLKTDGFFEFSLRFFCLPPSTSWKNHLNYFGLTAVTAPGGAIALIDLQSSKGRKEAEARSFHPPLATAKDAHFDTSSIHPIHPLSQT